MKRFSVIFLIFLSILLTNIEELKAVDPPCSGIFQEQFFDMLVFDCIYKVRVCIVCEATPFGTQANVILMGYSKLVSECEQSPIKTHEEIISKIEEQVLEPIYVNIACNLLMTPPCEQNQFRWITISTPVCWKKAWFEVNEEELMWIIPCNLNPVTCDRGVKVCWDNQGAMHTDYWFGPDYSGFPECDKEDLEPPNPSIGFESACFFIVTPCYQP